MRERERERENEKETGKRKRSEFQPIFQTVKLKIIRSEYLERTHLKKREWIQKLLV
jgi:hypothetical protein